MNRKTDTWMMKEKLGIILYSLHVFWTGLWASISAQAFKQNAFWFCLVLGLVCLSGAILMQMRRVKTGRILVTVAAAIILSFYTYSFVSDPAVDATFRVGLIILSSIGVLSGLLFARLNEI